VSGPPLSALEQPQLPIGGIPRDRTLRESLLWIASRVEGEGPAGIGISPDGQAWADLQRAIRWIYEHATERAPDAETTNR
jgi:hypothetical protein